jgi:hypothetical protein
VVPVASAMAVMIFADFAGTQTHPTQVHREQTYSFGRRHHFKKPCRHMAKPEMHPIHTFVLSRLISLLKHWRPRSR